MKIEKEATESLLRSGRELYARMQYNLAAVATSTDEQLANPDVMDEMFGKSLTPEDRRDQARRTQDALDRKGRADFAREYAEQQSANYRL